MVGSNTLALNTATMIEAVQEYLNNRFVMNHEVTVTNVKALVTNGVSTFEVDFKTRGEDDQK